MKYFSILLFFSAIVIAGCKTENKQTTGEYQLIDIPSPSLKNAIINPKETQKVGIYLPPSYNTSDKRYPVVYFLTGFTVHPGEYPPMPWMDSIMRYGLVQEMIYVDISGFNLFQGTMYANSSLTGNWEDFVTQDVIQYIDRTYRTIPERESRGISGHSMGGAGCFNISLKHADKYAVAYPMSPAIYTGESLMKLMFRTDSTMILLENLEKQLANTEKEALFERLQNIVDTNNTNVLWLLGNGSAFASDLSKPLGFALPFDRSKDGAYVKNEAIWYKWESGLGNLDQKVKDYKENLQHYRHYSIDCGYYDEIQGLKEGVSYVAELFEKEQIPISTHWYDGDHVNKVGEQMSGRLMPIMSAYLVREE